MKNRCSKRIKSTENTKLLEAEDLLLAVDMPRGMHEASVQTADSESEGEVAVDVESMKL